MSRTDGLIELEGIYEVSDVIVIEESTAQWCKLEYPRHPDGCPMYDEDCRCKSLQNESIDVPDEVKLSEFIDTSKKMWFIVVEFDFKTYLERVEDAHPDWSDAMLRNPLYWQNSVRKTQNKEVDKFKTTHPNTVDTLVPEAFGVNVFRTCHKIDVPIKVNPKDIIYKVALVGYPRDNPNNLSKWI